VADNVELVRRLWTAFARAGIEAVLEIADPDVEWEPYGGGGVVYHGHAGLAAYMQDRRDRDEEADAQLYSAFAKGDAVVGRGEVRIRGPQGLVTMQPGWLYEFRDGKLIRFRGFPTQEAALRAAGLAPEDAAATVRQFWVAVNKRDAESMVALCSDDEGVRDFYGDQQGRVQSINVSEYAFREFGDELIAFSGSLHTVDNHGGIAQRQIHYLFWVREGKIYRAQSFAHRTDAIRTAEAAHAAPPG
jgi:ketosteroid isomerase-like protein